MSTRPSPGALTTALEAATRAVDDAVRERVRSGRPPRPDTVCAETWHLIQLLGALGELTATLAPDVGRYPQHYRLRTDNDTDPARQVAHACRELAALRHALDDGRRATREIHAAVSHLHPVPSPEHQDG